MVEGVCIFVLETFLLSGQADAEVLLAYLGLS